jgi:hypothetical protein
MNSELELDDSDFKKIHQLTIDFGGHPNERARTERSVKIIEQFCALDHSVDALQRPDHWHRHERQQRHHHADRPPHQPVTLRS